MQSLFSKTPVRLKISANSKTDQPTQALVRGSNFEKNINFSEIKETIIDLPDQGNYEVILIWKSGFTEKRTVNVTEKDFSIEFGSNSNISADAINVTAKRPEAPPNYVLSQEDAIRMPGGFGDALKAVQSMPGISPMYQMYTGA
ncbi:hypothetical protein LEP1GSC053_0204 [Leptospira interrogans serovar Muenchen str. Brem 129]|nr:hypothetical protein LEP1GSC053_0204 [Leptospira interrogans serovar Muenchen str. Brem 129]